MIGRMLIAALLLFAAPAAAQEVTLLPGERVVVVEVGDGALALAPGERAELSDYDVDALLDLLENYAEAVGPDAAVLSSESDPPPLVVGTIRISLVALSDGSSPPQMLLMVENGFEREFRYRARIAVGDESVETDVCTVLPVLRGYEHWPYPFERIELSDFTLLPARPGEAPVCG